MKPSTLSLDFMKDLLEVTVAVLDCGTGRAYPSGHVDLIAALSAGTVIVEAGRNSATSHGCHLLIQHGDAFLVTCGADVIETLTGGEWGARSLPCAGCR